MGSMRIVFVVEDVQTNGATTALVHTTENYVIIINRNSDWIADICLSVLM